jgi:hypothetical protein
MLLNAPPSFVWAIDPSVTIKRSRCGGADVVVAFYTNSKTLSRQIESLARVIFPSSSLWLAWPKRSSGLATDITDHVVRDVVLPLGLVDDKVCAIDETWTALRFVWRVERRDGLL